jgi:hypothetical protein
LKYHLYSVYFPLMALARYAREKGDHLKFRMTEWAAPAR